MCSHSLGTRVPDYSAVREYSGTETSVATDIILRSINIYGCGVACISLVPV